MLINVFNYYSHIVSIRAYSGTFEYIIEGVVQGTTHSEEEAVDNAKRFIRDNLVGWQDEEQEV